MIDQRQMDKICDLLVNYRKAIVDVTTAAPEDRLEAAYEFACVDQMIHELLGSWVSDDAPVADSDGWIAWDGGEDCPVANGTYTEVRFRMGTVECDDTPEGWDWCNDGVGGDIVAYRVVSE